MPNMQKTKRLFIAVNLPQEVKNKIAEALDIIPKDRWRKVKAENLHVTLAFLGWQNKEQEKKAEQAMEKISGYGEFEIELNGFGHFDGRVLWAGIGKGADELTTLSKKLNEELGTKDERFHSHITLARNKGAKRDDAKGLVEKLRETQLEKTIKIKSIELMQSILHTSGPEYHSIFSTEL